MVFSNFKKMSKWGVAASVAVALLGAGSAAYAGFAVGSIGSAKGLKATPSTDVFGNSLDNLILGQLSTEDLDSAGIDYSACGSSPLPAYVLDYLETILSQDAEDTSNWQSDVDGISDCDFDAAVWQVGEANDNNSAATVVTASILDEIVNDDGYVNALLAANSSTDISDIQALFPNALASVTASSVKTMVAETVVGFASQAEATAFLANSDKANFTVTTFNACYTSSNSNTGGASSCTITNSSWSSIQTAQNIADNASSSTLTAANVTDLLALEGATLNANISTSNSKHLDYLTDCISGAADATSQLATCNTGFDNATFTKFEIHKIVEGDYGVSDLTVSKLTTTGALSDSDDESIVAGNYCGSNGSSSCLAVLKAGLDNASFTSSTPSTTEINDWIKLVITEDLKAQANGYSVTNPASAANCNTSIQVNMPGACDHPSWTCTTSDSNITLSDTNSNGHDDRATLSSNTNANAETYNYTIKRTLTFYGGSSYFKNHSYSINLTAAASSTSTWNSYTGWDIEAICNSCPSGSRLATRAEVVASGRSNPGLGWWTDALPTASSGVESKCKLPPPPTTSGQTQTTFCSSGTCGVTLKKRDNWNCTTGIKKSGHCYYTSYQTDWQYWCVSKYPTCN